MGIVPTTVSKIVLLIATQVVAWLLDCSSSNSDSLDLKFNWSGKYECNANCIRDKSYKICSHTVAAAERKSELRNSVGYFKTHFFLKKNLQHHRILTPNSSILETSVPKLSLIQPTFHATPSNLKASFQQPKNPDPKPPTFLTAILSFREGKDLWLITKSRQLIGKDDNNNLEYTTHFKKLMFIFWNTV